MPHEEHTVTVDRPIEQVFAYLSDEENDPAWRSGILEIKRVSPEGGKGATIRQVLRGPGGMKMRGDYRITEYLPPNRYEFQVIAGPARPAGRFALAEDGPDRTTVTFSLDLEPKGMARLMAGQIAKQMRVEVGALDKLKQNLER